MNLGLCGPIDSRALAAYLDPAEETPAGLGGSPVVALAQAAIEKGWRVTVFSLDPSVNSEVVVTGARGLKLCFGPFRERHRARDLFRWEREYLQQAIRRERPDVVHAHWTYEFALGAMAAGLPALVTAHDRPLRILRWDRSPYRIVRAYMAAMVARGARRMTAVSQPVAEHFRRFLRRAPAPEVIPNAIDGRWFRETPAPDAPKEFTFAAVLTGWGGLKNGGTLLKAFARVRRELPAARLQLFGHGHGPDEEAEGWARARGLQAGVSFIGNVAAHTLRERVQRAHVLVHPSLEETFSMAVAEAMASSVAAIVSRQAAGVADETIALFADGESPEALATEMLRLAHDPNLRRLLAARGYAAMRSRCGADEVLDQYAAVYRRL